MCLNHLRVCVYKYTEKLKNKQKVIKKFHFLHGAEDSVASMKRFMVK